MQGKVTERELVVLAMNNEADTLILVRKELAKAIGYKTDTDTSVHSAEAAVHALRALRTYMTLCNRNSNA